MLFGPVSGPPISSTELLLALRLTEFGCFWLGCCRGDSLPLTSVFYWNLLLLEASDGLFRPPETIL